MTCQSTPRSGTNHPLRLLRLPAQRLGASEQVVISCLEREIRPLGIASAVPSDYRR